MHKETMQEKTTTPRPNRRDLLKRSLAALAAGTLVGDGASARAAAPASAPASASSISSKPFRVVHLTDSHVEPELGATEGLTRCLRHIMANHKPDLIIAGGDNVMDAVNQPRARAALLFDLWSRTLKAECDVPVISVMGNHDMWGWNKTKSDTTGTEPDWGKAWPIAAYAMPARYYSLDRGGWHIVVLDSIQPVGASGFEAFLDDEQFTWLASDLSATDPATPILIASHVPILSTTTLFTGETDTVASPAGAPPHWQISRALMHTDARRIKDLFKQHPNVKLALSGHTHMTDRVDYLGVAYLNNTAVSGNWWKGDHQEFTNGYTVIDLASDGTFAHASVAYGWKAHPTTTTAAS